MSVLRIIIVSLWDQASPDSTPYGDGGGTTIDKSLINGTIRLEEAIRNTLPG